MNKLVEKGEKLRSLLAHLLSKHPTHHICRLSICCLIHLYNISIQLVQASFLNLCEYLVPSIARIPRECFLALLVSASCNSFSAIIIISPTAQLTTTPTPASLADLSPYGIASKCLCPASPRSVSALSHSHFLLTTPFFDLQGQSSIHLTSVHCNLSLPHGPGPSIHLQSWPNSSLSLLTSPRRKLKSKPCPTIPTTLQFSSSPHNMSVSLSFH